MDWLLDMDFQSLLVWVGGTLLLCVFLDGWRRIRASHHEQHRYAKTMEAQEAAMDTVDVIEEQQQDADDQQQVDEAPVAHVQQVDQSDRSMPVDFDELIILHVFAAQKQVFDATRLKQVFEANGLVFGRLNIYHSFGAGEYAQDVEFSVVNAVHPGHFNLQESQFTTPGISFFMRLPGPQRPISTLNKMFDCAQRIATCFGTVVRDDQQMLMTPQLLEHYRQRIADITRAEKLKQVALTTE